MNQPLEFVVPTEPQGSPELGLTLNQVAICLQAAAAFGLAAGGTRVSRAAMAAFHTHYFQAVTPKVEARWDYLAPQLLARVEASGRLAALTATLAGRTEITPEDFFDAVRTVTITSSSPYCPPVDNLPHS